MSNYVCAVDSCPVILSSTCVIYQGESLIYTGINDGDSVQTALQKIDAAFADAGLGYAFQNGVIQTTPGVPVELGGALLHDTTIGGNYKLTLAGRIQASALITTGGTSSQFVKGDGSLDSTAYQVAGNYITALTGDGTASGPGSAVLTLATVNANPGTYGSATLIPRVTVDAKGRVTAITTTAVPIPSGILVFEGDVTGSGTTGAPVVLTLATVNPNVYNSLTFLNLKVNAKGLVTGASPVTNLNIEGALGYVPVPNSRTITINGITQSLQANRTWTLPVGVASVTASAPLSSTGGADPNISITKADATTDGYLDNADWVTFNAKQAALNGTGLVRMSGTTVTYDNTAYTPQSRTLSINGTSYDLSADRSWTINSMVYPGAGIAVSTGTGWTTSIVDNSTNWNTAYTERISSASSPLSIGSNAISISQAGAAANGYLSSTDWNTFNNKQAAGDYITSLTGEATAIGPGIATVTLSTPAVTSKLLTGVNITGGTVLDTDSILIAVGKLQNQINGLIGGSIYEGTWNADTNTPTLTSSVGTDGHYYIVNVAGNTNLDGITDWHIGDWAIFHGGVWQQVDNTDAVVSVNGYTGAVSLVSSDIPEGLTNLYYTPARARTAISLTTTGTSGAATYDNITGILNVPNYAPDLSGYVPYTGATTNVDLGVHGIKATTLSVNTTPPASVNVGDIVWNPIDGTFDMNLLNSVTLQAGQELHFYGKAVGAIANGQAVMFAGVQGDHLLLTLADPTTINANPEYFIGVATQDFVNNDFGYVTILGSVRGLNTLAYTLGEILYFDSTAVSPGLLTGTRPVAPNAKIEVCAVVRVHGTQGILKVRPHVMPRLSDVQDVYAPTVVTNDILAWDTDRWEAKTIASVLGYTPANDANVVHTTGNETIAGVKTFSNNVKIDGDFYLKQDSTFGAIAGYNAITADTGGFFLRTSTTTIYAYLAFNNLTTYHNYSFPDATGTLALTSDLSSYVPTTRTLTINGTAYDLSADRSWTIASGVTSFNTRTGAITLTSGDVTTALGYTPYNSTNPSGYITGITSGMVTTALGYTPYNSSNPSGYITSSGTAAAINQTVGAGSEANLVYSQIADNDFFRIRVGGSSNAGWAEIATADDGTEPIYVRQYTGTFASITRTATLLDSSGNTSFPGTVTAPTFSGSLSGNASSATTAGSLSSMNISQFTNNSGYITSASLTQLVSPNGASVVSADSAMPNAGQSFIHTLALGPGGNDGHILGMTWANTTSVYGAQIWVDTDPTNTMAFRSRSSGGAWTGWNTIIHSNNIGSQSVNYANSAGSASSATNATYVTHLSGRTDSSSYPVVWASGNPSHMYSCDAVRITSNTGTISANTFSGSLSGNASSASTASTLSTNATITGLNFGGVFALTASGANTGNSTGARLSESYGPVWNCGDGATWHHQVINGSSLVGINAGGTNYGSGRIYAAGNITSTGGNVRSNNWLYSEGNSGWYNDTYGQGLRQVKGNVTYGNVIAYGENYNGWGGFNINNSTITAFMQNSSGTHGFYQENNAGWVLFWNAGYACWGMGTDATDPSYSLHITKYGGSNTGWIIWSDRRIKENIKTIDSALDKILSLRGVYYNKIDDPNKERCVGYIAQEVLEVVPELVVYSEELDMYNMNYAPMVAMLTEAMKEQQTQIEAQKVRLDTQQAEIDTLKQQVQTLLNYMNNGIQNQ